MQMNMPNATDNEREIRFFFLHFSLSLLHLCVCVGVFVSSLGSFNDFLFLFFMRMRSGKKNIQTLPFAHSCHLQQKSKDLEWAMKCCVFCHFSNFCADKRDSNCTFLFFSISLHFRWLCTKYLNFSYSFASTWRRKDYAFFCMPFRLAVFLFHLWIVKWVAIM